ncbi:DNA polymerase III subunit beta family protein [Nocardia pseudovaccinii]|uniref:DNA polymerase III subunit beta family protein n=1 Tax=Nocardia pseudovaccinii TaxID=189540 RepID=UPI0007A50333|nr:MerR family transcriptional regulator [Nocardia pseudovaccinii]
MAGNGLITIGGLARACGLTASALRFYDDCGLLVPVRVDEATGYRYYSEAQVERGVMIRRLRGIGVPLEVVSEILNGDAARAGRLLDVHVAELAQRAREAAAVARVIKEEIGAGVVLSAAVLAAAIEQVRSAAALDREIPVLAGVLVESGADSVTLTATDRYRLSTRAVVPVRPSGGAWSVVVDAGELGGIGSWLRGLGEVTVRASGEGLVLTGGGSERRCGTIDEAFPDYRAMLAGLGAVRTRVVVGRDALLAVLEGGAAPVVFAVDQSGLLATCAGQLRPGSPGYADPLARLHIPATVTGPGIELAFSPETLRPALVSAIGPEIMLDIAAADAPVVVRSATDGELTTLVMPTAITDSKEYGA